MMAYKTFAWRTERQATMSSAAHSRNSEPDGLFKNYGAIAPVKGELENGASSSSEGPQIGLVSATFIIFNCMVGAG